MTADLAPSLLPAVFEQWFANKGWQLRDHQAQLIQAAERKQHALLMAPTGAGKTLAGFLPSLIDLHNAPFEGLHTLYISPLKALAADIERNLVAPISDMSLRLSVGTRTGDTSQAERERQRKTPPNLLLTTPESFALLLSYPTAAAMFATLRCVIIDELHALNTIKRGDLLSLGLARLNSLAPDHRRVGLSATLADADWARAWLSPRGEIDDPALTTIQGPSGLAPRIDIACPPEGMPWAGRMGLYASAKVYEHILQARLALVFVNTRAQAELIFNELWRMNDQNLAIALHHGSLDLEQRLRVEAAMAAGQLRAVVATSSLDLGIDWGDIDLVIQVGAPKGASRLVQRIGRANHRLDEASHAVLIPANRFELLECQAAKDAILAGELDGEAPYPGTLDVLAQHIWAVACQGAFHPTDLYEEVLNAAPFQSLSRKDFDDTLAFIAHGGYALRAYERYRRLKALPDGRYAIASPAHLRAYRNNVGVIVEAPMLKVKKGFKTIGELEESFAMQLAAGDTFMFGGQVLEFIEIQQTDMKVKAAAADRSAKVAVYGGARLPISTQLAERVRGLMSHPGQWRNFPDEVQDWLKIQQARSGMPSAERLLIESFPRAGKEYLVAYTFEGRNAHQTLGMLLTRRLDREGCGALGFVGTDYAIATWALNQHPDVERLFDQDMLGDDLEAWMQETSLMKRTFKSCAIIGGLIERLYPSQRKSRRQVTFNTDIIYDVLRSHEPDHVLLRATRAEAARGLCDIRRLSDMLTRFAGRIDYRRLDRVSPLAVPIMLELGRESVYGEADEMMLDELAEDLIEEAMS